MEAERPHVSRVRSRDGTEIGYWTSGTGPPVVFVHGTTADHTSWRMMLPYLESHLTVHAVDRRGRGASGDAADYHLEREFEDVAAVVDTVAEASGSRVGLFGHSFGAVCALGAAALSSAVVGGMVLYEPYLEPDEAASPPGLAERLEALVAAGDDEAALETFYREVLGLSEEELDGFRAQPSWGPRAAAAYTIAREIRAEASGPFDPERTARIAAPTLLVLGGDSPSFVAGDTRRVAAALPDANVVVLEGQEHLAHYTIPDILAEHVIAFLRSRL